MSNQPQDTPRGQIAFNTGATPPKSAITKVSKAIDPNNGAQNMKGMQHNARLSRHNGKVQGKV